MFVKRAIGVLTSFRFALILLLVLAIACAAGSVLEAVGVAGIYSSWWFVALLCILAASLLACTFQRFASAIKRSDRMTGRSFGSILTHASILLILVGGIVRVAWGERGRITLREGQRAASFVSDEGDVPLPFDIRLVDFTVEKNNDGEGPARVVDEKLLVVWPARELMAQLPVKPGTEQLLSPPGRQDQPEDSFRIAVLKRESDLVVDGESGEITSRSTEPRNPAILVRVVWGGITNNHWLFANYPDLDMGSKNPGQPELSMRYLVEIGATRPASVRNYASTVEVLDGDDVLAEGVIKVNAPFSYDGYKFYQFSYNPQDTTWTSLQVVRDPSVPLVFTGFGMMLVGLTTVLYVCRDSDACVAREKTTS